MKRKTVVFISCTSTFVFLMMLQTENSELRSRWQRTNHRLLGLATVYVTPSEKFTTTGLNNSRHSNPRITNNKRSHDEKTSDELSADYPFAKYKAASRPTLDDCYRIIETQGSEENRSSVATIPDPTSDEAVIEILDQGCEKLKSRYSFFTTREEKRYSTKEEVEYPIAYTILLHKNLHQVATLLSAIYRSQNIFCLQMDTKSSMIFQEGVLKMTGCFPNVFKASKSERVVYASFSRLAAEVHCMKDLLNVPQHMYEWKYLINLCGQDFPVSTNLEIVKQLKALNGESSIAGTRHLNDVAVRRIKYVHEIRNVTIGNRTTEEIFETKRLLEPAPYNLTIVKNLAYGIFSREFLQWALVDSKEGQALYNWTRFTRTPDEHFWGTLYQFTGSPVFSRKISWRGIARAVLWKSTAGADNCQGLWQHSSCIFGSGGLKWVTKAQQIFVNKFDFSYDATPVRCLRMLIDERTRRNSTKRNSDKIPMTL